MTRPRSAGFTLIELLVVIAIIGLLSSIVLASLNTARTKGQDAARISDIKSIETAMELYYDAHGTYPQITGIGNGDGYINDPQFVTALVGGGYIGSIPASLGSGTGNDGDRYYGVGTSGGTSQYGLYVYTAAGNGYCKTGVSSTNMTTNGWWGTPPVCNF